MPEINGFEFEYVMNPDVGGDTPEAFSAAKARQVHRFHRDIPGYTETPLAGLISLASAWGVGGVFVKDESQRFGLTPSRRWAADTRCPLLCEKLDWTTPDRFNPLLDPECSPRSAASR